jgi:phospholipid transport system transporter-binding protein
MLLMPATVTINGSRDALRMLSQGVRTEPESGVVIDASALQQFDTSALAVLLECQRLAKADGKSFSLRQAPAKLHALAKLYGVDALLLPEAVPA